MFRRRFLKTVLAAIGAMFVPKKTETAETPFLPTLEWFRERDPHISTIQFDLRQVGVTYDGCVDYTLSPPTDGQWTATIFRKRHGGSLRDHTACLMYVDQEWIAIQEQRIDDHGQWDYEKETDWPDWLRKF